MFKRINLRNCINIRKYSTNLHIIDYATIVFNSKDANLKISKTEEAQQQMMNGNLQIPKGEIEIKIGTNPGRPDKPLLVDHKNVPKSHKQANTTFSVYTLHNIAHIELNAIDLTWHNILMPFLLKMEMPDEFYYDMLKIAHDEASHFKALCERLNELNASYGMVDSHNGLWRVGIETSHDLKERLAIVQMIQEARGLDSGPRLSHKLRSEGDKTSAELIKYICDEEESHVRFGIKWFTYLCEKENLNPKEKFHEIAKKHLRNPLPLPFNDEARKRAGFEKDWYEPLSKPNFIK